MHGRDIGILGLLLASFLAPPALAASVSQVFSLPTTSDGQYPVGALTYFDGAYYGLTLGNDVTGSSYGTIYSVDPATGAETTLYNFPGNAANGAYPEGSLVEYSGKLYGVAGRYAGSNVFSFDPATGTETNILTLPEYDDISGNLAAYGGLLYATMWNLNAAPIDYQVISIDPVSGAFRTVYSFPSSTGNPNGLMVHGNMLFGTTLGHSIPASIYSLDPATGDVKIVHNFGGSGDGVTPRGGLVGLNGILYGTTVDGGQAGLGTVFAYDPASRTESVIHSFSGPDGSGPSPMLMEAGGLLYGATQLGGANNAGTVYAVDPSTDQETVVYSFTHGQCSGYQGLTAWAGRLLGVASNGGAGAAGCLYSVTPSTGQYASVHQFGGAPVSYASGLTTVGSVLYGTAEGGGTNALGVIYKYDPLTGTGQDIYDFNGADGGKPLGPLTFLGGLLYGTTSTGGGYNAGTIFSFDPKRRVLTTLYSFTGGDDGGSPSCRLVFARDALFGVIAGFAPKDTDGSVFEIGLAHLTFRTVFKFTQSSGVTPAVDMTLANGTLYGLTRLDGGQLNDNGTLFSLDPATGVETTLYTFQGNGFGEFGQPSGLTYGGGLLYGIDAEPVNSNASTVYQFNPVTNAESAVHTFKVGNNPLPFALTPVGDQFYGFATLKTGVNAVMRVDPVNGVVTYDSLPSSPLLTPQTPLIRDRTAYYFAGYTSDNDVSNALTLYKFQP